MVHADAHGIVEGALRHIVAGGVLKQTVIASRAVHQQNGIVVLAVFRNPNPSAKEVRFQPRLRLIRIVLEVVTAQARKKLGQLDQELAAHLDGGRQIPMSGQSRWVSAFFFKLVLPKNSQKFAREMSTTAMPKLSKEVLHNALIANGVTPAATIPEMTAQLHAAAAAGRKKPGPKPKAPPKGGGVTFNIDPEEIAFYASEKPILMAAGMTDPAKIAAELPRRYTIMKGTGGKTSNEKGKKLKKPATSGKRKQREEESDDDDDDDSDEEDCEQKRRRRSV